MSEFFSTPIQGLDYMTFFSIIDQSYDELLIYDDNYNIVYINQACSRHYGCSSAEMIGKNFYDLVSEDWWNPSLLPIVYKEKKPFAQKQMTRVGAELLTIAIPVFDDKQKLRFVVMNVRDNINEADLYHPPQFETVSSEEPETDIVYNSPVMLKIIASAKKIAQLQAPCIISGEAGVGKSTLAKYIHKHSPRKDNPYLVIHCASLSEENLQNELELGMTDTGKLSAVKDGTLVFTNIEKLSLATQNKLCEYIAYIQSKESGTSFIATTSRDLAQMITYNQFHKGLYYILHVSDILIPPLRKRPEDISILISTFLNHFSEKYHYTRYFSEAALQIMQQADWNNNVRELKYVVERLFISSETIVIDADQLPSLLFGISQNENSLLSADSGMGFDDRITQYESLLIHDAYEKYGTSRNVAAHLKISQTKANKLINKYIHK